MIYARISEDASGEGLGVERQIDDCRALAKVRGLTIVEECADNDISALTGRTRPGYARVIHLVASGAVDHVIVWQSSRLIRNRRERAEAIEMFGRQRVGIMAVRGQDLDLSNAYGRGMAGLLGEFDTMESEVKGERVAAAAAQRARKGIPNGNLGYGWTKTPTGYEIEPTEAAIVREIVQRLADRHSLLGVTADLNARGVPSPDASMWSRLSKEEQDRRVHRGRPVPPVAWGKTSVKKIAIRPSNVGLRVHHVGRTDQQITDGVWPSLVDRRTWDRACAVLAAPERRSTPVTRPGARRHLLSWGIGECGVCGAYLRVSLKGSQRYGTKARLYVCERGCTGRNEGRVDDLVRGVVLERLSRPDALDWLMGDEEAAKAAGARARELDQRLTTAARLFAAGKITDMMLETITEELTPLIAAAEEERARHVGSRDLDTLAALAGPEAASRWDAKTVVQRRAILEALRMRVILDRVARRGPGFDPESVRIEWRVPA